MADRITGSVRDARCGTGESALFFADRDQPVTGIDFLAEPITVAKQKATERGLTATFLVIDVLALKELHEVFDSAIDSGLFHVFSDDDLRCYVEDLASVLKPGGRLFLLCFSDAEPGDEVPRRASRNEIEDAFAEGWGGRIHRAGPVRSSTRSEGRELRGRWPEGVVCGGEKCGNQVVPQAGNLVRLRLAIECRQRFEDSPKMPSDVGWLQADC